MWNLETGNYIFPQKITEKKNMTDFSHSIIGYCFTYFTEMKATQTVRLQGIFDGVISFTTIPN